MMLLARLFLLSFLLTFGSFNPLVEKSAVQIPSAHPQTNALIAPEALAAQNYFGAVLDILPPTIVGNFGEPRRLHFHTGLDFRTNQEEGHVVFAAADGYISRINVSSGGYGNALYITHPNGYVTVYGHLQRFYGRIHERLRKEQYANESFAVDFNPSSNEIIVKKGDTIAYSGNTGGSGGPHLHFEIRDTFENVYNPMLFGYKLKDNMKPVVGYVKFYPLDTMKYKCNGYRIRPTLKNGLYEFANGTVKLNADKVGFSINTYDVLNLTPAQVGIYNLTVFDGDKMIYDARFDKLTFPERRCVLSHVDYPVFMHEGRKSFHRCFQEPGNACSIYSNVVNAGEIDLSDKKEHHLSIEVTDFSGNVAQVKMKLMQDASSVLFKPTALSYTTRFDYDHDNEYSNPGFKLKIPEGCLFEHVFFKYADTTSSDSTIYSKVHSAGNSDVLLYDWFTVSVKTEKLSKQLQDKAVVVYKDKSGAASCKGGTFENGFVTAKAREFGKFYIKIDTTAPKIKPVNITAGRNMRNYKKVLFKISDNLSGVADFDTYVDGKWVVTDYDGKSATLTHVLDPKLAAGEHIFKVVVTDERKNRAEYSVKFAM